MDSDVYRRCLKFEMKSPQAPEADARSRLEAIARQVGGPEKLRRQLHDSAISVRFRNLLSDILERLDKQSQHAD